MRHICQSVAVLLLSVVFNNAYSFNLRKVIGEDGLSNNSVTSMIQDHRNFLWIATYDGLNLFDGRNMRCFKPDIDSEVTLSSNVIYNIVRYDDEYIWLNTKWGLDKFSTVQNKVVERFPEFNGDCCVALDSFGNLICLNYVGFLSIYNPAEKAFAHLPIEPGAKSTREYKNLVIDGGNTIFVRLGGRLLRYKLSNAGPDGSLRIIPLQELEHQTTIEYMFEADGKVIFLDSEKDLYMVEDSQKLKITNISQLVAQYGNISSVLFDGKDLLLAFRANGLVRLSEAEEYSPKLIYDDCGVFSLYKDEKQGVIWFGTDGDGIYALTDDEQTFHNIPLVDIPINKKRPIKAIHTDAHDNLWLSSKENGIIKISNYETNDNSISKYTKAQGLTNNNVLSFKYDHRHNLMWIGTDKGIDYYDYAQSKIIHFDIPSEKAEVLSVNSIINKGDSLLWVASRSSLLKMIISQDRGRWRASTINRYDFNLKFRQITDQISSLCFENDSTLWIGVRGNSAIRFNTNSNESESFTFNSDGFEPMNDVLCIHIDDAKNIWFGTSYGLIKLANDDTVTNISVLDGLINNTIHGITKADNGKLWLSSNKGLILFDPQTISFRNYNKQTGVCSEEFNDNAFFRDETKSISFFGGNDGIVWISDNQTKPQSYTPEIHFTSIKVFNEEHNISDFETLDTKGKCIELSYRQNFFSVGFIAVDYLNGASGSYSYKLGNFNDLWSHSTSNEAHFTNVAPGNYTLYVKYNNGVSPDTSTGMLRIKVLPPWYKTVVSKIIFYLILLSIIVLAAFLIRKKIKEKNARTAHRLTEKYKEDVYESKLRFFTNITHEFCTPLSLIYAPCNKLLREEQLSPSIRKYVEIIKSNTERLNALIQEAIDFRKVETGNTNCSIKRVQVGYILKDLRQSFEEMADQHRILFNVDCIESLEWNSDESCLNKILNNLISNAFKYTSEGGEVSVSVKIVSSKLIIDVYNTGAGISEKDLPNIFDSYTVLDNVSDYTRKGLMSRNGLGLSICQSMVQLLEGTIEVNSKENEYTRFVVSLPYLKEESMSAAVLSAKEEIPLKDADISIEGHPTILILDDNTDILWLLNDIFSKDYNVICADNAEKGMEHIKELVPDIIISDVMMPGTDGLSFLSTLKHNQHTAHIPVIILSAKGSTQDKIAGIEAGADMYISKPFDIDYIKVAVKKLLLKAKNLSSYYKSSASSFEFFKGKLVNKKDKSFIDKVSQIAKDNISNSSFTPADMAEELNLGLRNLYRKFSELELAPPKEFIKTARINYAAYLLRTTKMTIEEVMYNSGFSNRSNFYKEFAKHTNKIPGEYKKEYSNKAN